MIGPFEEKGIWWLPENPNNQVTGMLTYKPREGAVLELIGSFEGFAGSLKLVHHEIILGFSSSGKEITLAKCYQSHSNVSFPGLQTSSFTCLEAMLGAHFKSVDEVKFKSVAVHYTNLNEWVNISGFDIRYSHDGSKITIKYDAPTHIEVPINDQYKLRISIYVKPPGFSQAQTEAGIVQKAYIEIEGSTLKPIEEYRRIMAHMQNLLTLGIGHTIYPLDIRGLLPISESEEENKSPPTTVEMFPTLPDIPDTHRIIIPPNMLFTYKDISSRFELLIKNWFEKEELLAPAYRQYFGTLYNPHSYLQHKFLSLAHGIESFHRRIINKSELSEEDHNRRIREIVNTVTKQYIRWLKSKLTYSNELTLRRRLKQIFDSYLGIVSHFIGDRNDFVQKVVVTRNYLIHYDESLKDRAAQGEELYDLTQKLRISLLICLLTDLGFRLDFIRKLFRRNSQYSKYILKQKQGL